MENQINIVDFKEIDKLLKLSLKPVLEINGCFFKITKKELAKGLKIRLENLIEAYDDRPSILLSIENSGCFSYIKIEKEPGQTNPYGKW